MKEQCEMIQINKNDHVPLTLIQGGPLGTVSIDCEKTIKTKIPKFDMDTYE